MPSPDIARLSHPNFFDSVQAVDEVASIILSSFFGLFALMLAGLAFYLYVAGALSTFHLKPFRLVVYLLVFACAMTVGIGLIHNSPTHLRP